LNTTRETYDALMLEEIDSEIDAHVEAWVWQVPHDEAAEIDLLVFLRDEQTFEEMTYGGEREVASIKAAITGVLDSLRRGDPDSAAHLRALACLPTKCLLKIGLESAARFRPSLATDSIPHQESYVPCTIKSCATELTRQSYTPRP
jgi:hypothetical protein